MGKRTTKLQQIIQHTFIRVDLQIKTKVLATDKLEEQRPTPGSRLMVKPQLSI